MKFTKEGGIISVNIYDKVENIVISVKDTGQGMPEEKQKIIFERFMQINNSDIQEYEGSGIGLSVVKSLVEMHEGSISCKSEYGEGSEFIIELPVITASKKIDMSEQISNKHLNNFTEKINIEFSDIYFNNYFFYLLIINNLFTRCEPPREAVSRRATQKDLYKLRKKYKKEYDWWVKP